MDILISLNSTDPLVGRLEVMRAPVSASARPDSQEFSFTGWLGLLRALYEVTGSPAESR